MANIRIPCLVAKKQKNGTFLWYWQPSKFLRDAGWRPLTLGKEEGTAIAKARQRNEDVEVWKAGGGRPDQVAPRRQPGTFAALIARYRGEVVNGKQPDGSSRLTPATRENYETSLRRLEAWAGKQPVDYITPARVRALRDATARPIDREHPERGGIGHASAHSLLRTLRQVMAFAEAVDIIPRGSNPARAFDLGLPKPRSTIWTLEDDAAFDAAAYELGMPDLALARALALYTAQRESDLIHFTEAQLTTLDILEPVLHTRLAGKDGKVLGWELTQGKTGHGMAIPLEPEIRERVEAAVRANRARDRAADPPRLITYVLVNPTTGLPWKKRHFITSWRKVLEHAAKRTGRDHMRGLVWHDLRRTRVVRLRRRGMNPAMIAAITGHSPRSIDMMLKVYGPVDPTITAAAIAGSLEPLPAKDEAGKEKQR